MPFASTLLEFSLFHFQHLIVETNGVEIKTVTVRRWGEKIALTLLQSIDDQTSNLENLASVHLTLWAIRGL